jgi:thiol reductant ABC exporter CydC subunit
MNRLLLATLRPVRWRLALAALLGALASGCAVALTATSAWLIARAAQQPPVLTLMVAAVAVRTFGVGRAVFRYLERLSAHDAALRVMAGLRTRVLSALVPLAPSQLRRMRRGDLLSRLIADVEAIEELGVRVVVPAISALVVGAAAVAFTAVLLPAAAGSLLAALLLGGVAVPCVVVLADRRAARRTAHARAELTTAVVDLVDGAAELTAYGAIDAALRGADEADRALSKLERRSARSLAAGSALSTAAAGIALWSAIAIGIPAVRAGALGGVLFVVVVLLAWSTSDVVADLPAVGQHLVHARESAARLLSEPTSPAPPPAHPSSLTVRGVVARHTPDGPATLDGVDLELRRGKRVVVTGASGAGKSTLLAVLLRFLEFEQGSVRVDGVDVKAMRTSDVRAIVGCCEQQPHLFDSTIRANLLVGDPDADDARLRAVADRVGLGGWVGSLPLGLDTRVGEGGAEVSGGQLRRIALARVLLADTPVVLFDEPTEGLEEAAAAALTVDVLAATADRAVLVVTHREMDIRPDDEVLDLVDGRLRARDYA